MNSVKVKNVETSIETLVSNCLSNAQILLSKTMLVKEIGNNLLVVNNSFLEYLNSILQKSKDFLKNVNSLLFNLENYKSKLVNDDEFTNTKEILDLTSNIKEVKETKLLFERIDLILSLLLNQFEDSEISFNERKKLVQIFSERLEFLVKNNQNFELALEESVSKFIFSDKEERGNDFRFYKDLITKNFNLNKNENELKFLLRELSLNASKVEQKLLEVYSKQIFNELQLKEFIKNPTNDKKFKNSFFVAKGKVLESEVKNILDILCGNTSKEEFEAFVTRLLKAKEFIFDGKYQNKELLYILNSNSLNLNAEINNISVSKAKSYIEVAFKLFSENYAKDLATEFEKLLATKEITTLTYNSFLEFLKFSTSNLVASTCSTKEVEFLRCKLDEDILRTYLIYEFQDSKNNLNLKVILEEIISNFLEDVNENAYYALIEKRLLLENLNDNKISLKKLFKATNLSKLVDESYIDSFGEVASNLLELHKPFWTVGISNVEGINYKQLLINTKTIEISTKLYQSKEFARVYEKFLEDPNFEFEKLIFDTEIFESQKVNDFSKIGDLVIDYMNEILDRYSKIVNPDQEQDDEQVDDDVIIDLDEI